MAGSSKPDYNGACISRLIPALLHHLETVGTGIKLSSSAAKRSSKPTPGSLPAWMPQLIESVRQVVVLVVDGLGWEQLTDRAHLTPGLNAMQGGAITTVAPTTTATALTSMTTGLAPAQHGVLGYRLRLRERDVLNVLRWEVGDRPERLEPSSLQTAEAFIGRDIPVITRHEYVASKFSEVCMRGSRKVGYGATSRVPVEVREFLNQGAPLVFVYYDRLDTVAHARGLGGDYDAEICVVDGLVSSLVDCLVPGSGLIVTSDHGQVQIDTPPIVLDVNVSSTVAFMSGEGRFRWLHCQGGAESATLDAARDIYGGVAWVRERGQLIDDGWFGGGMTAAYAKRLGDVAILCHAPVSIHDPAEVGSSALRCRHGSVTSAEMLVPLLAQSR